MDYKNGKIYSIRSYQTDQLYIGSTTQSLTKRFGFHKRQYKYYVLEKSNFISSFEILKFDDAYIELIEEYPCENREQLCKKEGEIIRIHNCVNKNIAGRTKKDYYEENKDKIKEKNKVYKIENEDKIKEYSKEYSKEYYKQNKDKYHKKILCECGGFHTIQHKSKHLKTARHQKYVVINEI